MNIEELVDYLTDSEIGSEDIDDFWLSKLSDFYESGGDVKEKTSRNNLELIHIAALNQLEKSVEWLVEKGADVNAMNDSGYAPLILAFGSDIDTPIQHGGEINFSCSKKLVELGADVSVTDPDGNSLEDIAKAYGKKMLSTYELHFKP